jgi:hypothetical protein
MEGRRNFEIFTTQRYSRIGQNLYLSQIAFKLIKNVCLSIGYICQHAIKIQLS